MIYKLDRHLKDWCDDHAEYGNLYATWSLNKKMCTETLKNVVVNYPHFSMHDASHSEAVIAKMEMLLGERIDKLSPTDTWLLLHAAYTHDLGMILTWDDVQKTWPAPEFQAFLTSLLQSDDPDLRRAAQYVQSNEAHKDDLTWPLEMYHSVTLINAAYFRSKHATISRTYMDRLGASLKVDFGHNQMIQPRLLKLLGRVCELHTMPSSKVLELPYETDGFGSDYAHPRFVAMLLRLGDILDIDNGRFNSTSELVFGNLPDSSVPHQEKHEATTHLLVTPREIQFGSDCPNQKAYLEARNFVTGLEEEIDFLTKYWVEIAPENIGGYPPRFRQAQLLINGVPDLQDVAGLHFEISQAKAFQIIEGSNIYEDKFVFIREVIQNAMDATKMQFWRDLKSGVYAAWVSNDSLTHLQPFHVDERVYEGYSIKVNLMTLPSGELQIEVVDRGTGISIDAFKRICNVGTSNAGSAQLMEEISSMPNWLRPTAGFGVGLQSIFLLADRFEADTSTGTEAYRAVFYSQRAGGHLQLQPLNESLPRGTTIRIVFRMPEQYSYNLFGNTHSYFSEHFDPMDSENHAGEARILDAIESYCGDSLFPIQVNCAESSLESRIIRHSLPVCGKSTAEWQLWKNRYRVNLEKETGKLLIWDEEQAVYGEFQTLSLGRSMSEIRFKGMEIEKRTPRTYVDSMRSSLDIYGLDTKQHVRLNRTAFTEEGYTQTSHIFESLFASAKEYFLQWLQGLSKGEQERVYQSNGFHPYSFWGACTAEQRNLIPQNLIDNITQTANILEKNPKGKWVKKQIEVRKIIPFTDHTYFLNIKHFDTHARPDNIDYGQILALLNNADIPEINQIVADKRLIDASELYYSKDVMMPCNCAPLILRTIYTDLSMPPLLTPDKRSREVIIQGLGGNQDETYCRRHLREGELAKRWAIPALESYKELVIEFAPHGTAYAYSSAYLGRQDHIISPFDRMIALKAKEMSKEAFTELVIAHPTFSNVVKYVQEHGKWAKDASPEQIIDLYRKLIGEYHDVMNK